MSNLHEAAQQALDLCEFLWREVAMNDYAEEKREAVEAALRAALAETVQEPVAYVHRQGNHWEVSERHLDSDEKARGWTEEPLYTAPPQRNPLTEEDIAKCWHNTSWHADMKTRVFDFARAIERHHKIGVE